MENTEQGTIGLTVVAVKKEEFTDKQTGEKRIMWKATVALPDGDTAKVYATYEVKHGQWMILEPRADKDGRLVLRARRSST